MKTNKLDNSIKEKLANRTFTPSNSAWERLSVRLDEAPKEKKKGMFFYIGVAATILLLVSLGVKFLSTENEGFVPKEEVVLEKIDKILIDKKLDNIKNEIPVEEVIVKNEKIEDKQDKIITENNFKNSKKNQTFNNKIVIKPEENITNLINKKPNKNLVLNVDSIKKNTLKQNPNSRIKINSEDLLFAVTHTPQEVKAYYAKYNISREDVLKTIRNQLNESNIKINPTTILAEVERTIDDDDFQNNFLKSLKRKVSDIASAIASRND